MDDRLERALEYSNFKVTIAQQKQNLRVRLEVMLTFATNGGTFKATRELISFVDVLVRNGDGEAVLLDIRDNPVRIDDLGQFRATLISRYHEALNEFHMEMDRLRRARNVKLAVSLA